MTINGEIKPGSRVNGREVAAIGSVVKLGLEDELIPVRFVDGKCAIVSIQDDQGFKNTSLWNPTTREATKAIEKSIDIPTVNRGLGSDVIHVHGKDSKGSFMVKLFYNEKAGRPSELLR